MVKKGLFLGFKIRKLRTKFEVKPSNASKGSYFFMAVVVVS